MKCSESARQHLFGAEEVVQVGAAEETAGITVALGVKGGGIVPELRVFNVDLAKSRKKLAIACVPGWHDTVEHIDPAIDSLEQVLRGSDSHEIARAIGRQAFGASLDHLVHERDRLADREPADGQAIESSWSLEFEFLNALNVFPTQVRVHAALDNSEEGVVGSA